MKTKGFPAVVGGTISVSGLENSLRRGAWSLDIFGWSAVVADEVLQLTSPGWEILSMAADHTKNRLKAGLPRHVVPPSGGNASNLTRQLDGRKKRKMPKERSSEVDAIHPADRWPRLRQALEFFRFFRFFRLNCCF